MYYYYILVVRVNEISNFHHYCPIRVSILKIEVSCSTVLRVFYCTYNVGEKLYFRATLITASFIIIIFCYLLFQAWKNLLASILITCSAPLHPSSSYFVLLLEFFCHFRGVHNNTSINIIMKGKC